MDVVGNASFKGEKPNLVQTSGLCVCVGGGEDAIQQFRPWESLATGWPPPAVVLLWPHHWQAQETNSMWRTATVMQPVHPAKSVTRPKCDPSKVLWSCV